MPGTVPWYVLPPLRTWHFSKQALLPNSVYLSVLSLPNAQVLRSVTGIALYCPFCNFLSNLLDLSAVETVVLLSIPYCRSKFLIYWEFPDFMSPVSPTRSISIQRKCYKIPLLGSFFQLVKPVFFK